MKSNPVLFIGYQSLDAWLHTIQSKEPVYVALINELGPFAGNRTRVEQMIVMLAQPIDNLVHYCRILVGELRMVNGEPFDLDHKQRRQKAADHFAEIQQKLVGEHLMVREGIIAAPINLRWVDVS